MESSSKNLIDVLIKTEITVQSDTKVPDLLAVFQRNKQIFSPWLFEPTTNIFVSSLFSSKKFADN